jgi:hypothetical protein
VRLALASAVARTRISEEDEMGKHDFSEWRITPDIPTWFDNVLTAICILVASFWAYDWIVMVAK